MRDFREDCSKHYITILKTTSEEISFWSWECYISFKIPKIKVDVTVIEFLKGGSQI